MASPHSSSAPHLIRMLDQHGQTVTLDVRQDGRLPGLVPPGKRTRFKIRAGALAYRINRLVLPECPENWRVCDLSVTGQSVFVALGDSLEEDGVPGEVFAAGVDACFVRFGTCQAYTDLVLDVTYHGPVERGAPFSCHLQCTTLCGRVALATDVPTLRRENSASTPNSSSACTLQLRFHSSALASTSFTLDVSVRRLSGFRATLEIAAVQELRQALDIILGPQATPDLALLLRRYFEIYDRACGPDGVWCHGDEYQALKAQLRQLVGAPPSKDGGR